MGQLSYTTEQIDEGIAIENANGSCVGGDKSLTNQGIGTLDIQTDRTAADISGIPSSAVNTDWTIPGTYDVGSDVLEDEYIEVADIESLNGYYNIAQPTWAPLTGTTAGENTDWTFPATYDICKNYEASVLISIETAAPYYRDFYNLANLAWAPLVTGWMIPQATVFDGTTTLGAETAFSAQGDDAVALGTHNYVEPNSGAWNVKGKWNAVVGYQNWTVGQGTSIVGNNNIIEKFWGCAFGDHNHVYDFAGRAFGNWNVLKGGDCFAVGTRNNTYGWSNHGYGFRNEIYGFQNYVFGSFNRVEEADGVGIYDSPDDVHHRFNHVFGMKNITDGNSNNIIGKDNIATGDNNFVAGINNSVTADNAVVIGTDLVNTYDNSIEIGSNSTNKIAIRGDERFIFPGMNAVAEPQVTNSALDSYLPDGHFTFWYDPGSPSKLYMYVNEGGTLKSVSIGDFTV